MKENITEMTVRQAFDAMRVFLTGYYRRTGSVDVASLLGDMKQAEDGSTMDPAAWCDWMESVETVVSGKKGLG